MRGALGKKTAGPQHKNLDPDLQADGRVTLQRSPFRICEGDKNRSLLETEMVAVPAKPLSHLRRERTKLTPLLKVRGI